MRYSPGIVLLVILYTTANAQPAPLDSTRVLRIGTKEAAPFTIKQPDGTWSGLSIELWQDIAQTLNLRYEFHETSLEGLLSGIEDGSLDAAVAALTVTAQREEAIDFTHPYHVSGLGIAVRTQQEDGWLGVVRRLLSPTFLKVVAALFGLLLLTGLLVWLFERKRNPDQFGGPPTKGIASGFWWSAVTMTTVGYGDKAPVTFGGRLIALVWMFAAIIIVSSFTAAITSALTVSQLEAVVQDPSDLPDVRVGSVAASTSENYLQRRRISYSPYATVTAGLEALARDEIDALVYDAPILRHLITTEYRGTLRVLPGTFETQYYGIALPKDSPLHEPVNLQLLEKIHLPTWEDMLYRYLGE